MLPLCCPIVTGPSLSDVLLVIYHMYNFLYSIRKVNKLVILCALISVFLLSARQSPATAGPIDAPRWPAILILKVLRISFSYYFRHYLEQIVFSFVLKHSIAQRRPARVGSHSRLFFYV